MTPWWMFYSWINQWPVSNSKYRLTFQLQRDSMKWKMTPWMICSSPTLHPPHSRHQVAKGECGKRHSWGNMAADTYMALTDLFCRLYFPFFLSCKHSRAFLLSLVCSRDWDLGEAGWYDNHQWHVLWPPEMCGGGGARSSHCSLPALALSPSLTVHHQLFRYYKIPGKRYWYVCLLISLIIDDDSMKYFLHCACKSNCQNKSQQVVFLYPGRTLRAILCGKYTGSGF